MFHWYSIANTCYVYMVDVSLQDSCESKWGGYTDSDAIRKPFMQSRWFARGWTLQKLLAPVYIEFYDRDWAEIGTNSSLEALIHERTKIRILTLRNPSDVFGCPVAERLSWAAHRETTRAEDIVYCLLGIFRLNMPLLYGEGARRAFFRLQQQILAQIEDFSLLAWNYEWAMDEFKKDAEFVWAGFLAPQPSVFRKLTVWRLSQTAQPVRETYEYRDIKTARQCAVFGNESGLPGMKKMDHPLEQIMGSEEPIVTEQIIKAPFFCWDSQSNSSTVQVSKHETFVYIFSVINRGTFTELDYGITTLSGGDQAEDALLLFLNYTPQGGAEAEIAGGRNGRMIRRQEIYAIPVSLVRKLELKHQLLSLRHKYIELHGTPGWGRDVDCNKIQLCLTSRISGMGPILLSQDGEAVRTIWSQHALDGGAERRAMLWIRDVGIDDYWGTVLALCISGNKCCPKDEIAVVIRFSSKRRPHEFTYCMIDVSPGASKHWVGELDAGNSLGDAVSWSNRASTMLPCNHVIGVATKMVQKDRLVIPFVNITLS